MGRDPTSRLRGTARLPSTEETLFNFGKHVRCVGASCVSRVNNTIPDGKQPQFQAEPLLRILSSFLSFSSAIRKLQLGVLISSFNFILTNRRSVLPAPSFIRENHLKSNYRENQSKIKTNYGMETAKFNMESCDTSRNSALEHSTITSPWRVRSCTK